MIVKYIGKKGGGSIKATFDYLLGKDRLREYATVLSGDPDLTQSLCESLDFKNKYTVGVLSFEEEDIKPEDKRAIMDQFEETTFAGLDKDNYNICWIEHKDKDRLELNFVIANVELSTRKRYQPYYDKVDRKTINNFQKVINHNYKLSDPDNPKKKQLSNSLSVKNIPKTTLELKNKIDEHIITLIKNNVINSQNDVINTLKDAGFIISRVTDKSISLKNPDPTGRNIRLKGAIYENRRFSEEFGNNHQQEIERYERERGNDYKRAFDELKKYSERKRKYNKKTYNEHNKAYIHSYNTRNYDRNIINDNAYNVLDSKRSDNGLEQSNSELKKPSNTENTVTEQTMEQSEFSRTGRAYIHSSRGKTGTLLPRKRKSNNTQYQLAEEINAKSLNEKHREISYRVRSRTSDFIGLSEAITGRADKRKERKERINQISEKATREIADFNKQQQQINNTEQRIRGQNERVIESMGRIRRTIQQIKSIIRKATKNISQGMSM